jgi:methionyl-tRNA formyltransferase
MHPRVLVCGNGNAAIGCIKALLNLNAEICGVLPDKNDGGTDGWQRSVVKYAHDHDIPVRQKSLKIPETILWIGEQKPDFIFSCQYYEIIPSELLIAQKFDVINLHFSPLPRYRGCFPGAWSIMNGEQTAGVTLHYIDEGIDTGDIIGQKIFTIEPVDNARTLYEKSVEHGISLFKEHLPLIFARTNKRVPQDGTSATYYGRNSIDFSQKRINWNQPTEKVFNWIRAFTFPPMQYPETTDGVNVLRVAKTERRLLKPLQKPGTVVTGNETGILVATLDGALLITQCTDDRYVPISLPNLPIGTKLS